MTTSIFDKNGKLLGDITLTVNTVKAAKAHADHLADKLGCDYAYFSITDHAKHTSRHYTREGKRTDELMKIIDATCPKIW